jgi:hypothetical protein
MYLPDGTYPHSLSGQKINKDDKMSRWFPTTKGALPATLPLMMNKLQSVRNDISLVSGFKSIFPSNCAAGGHGAPSQFLTGNSLTSSYCGNQTSPNDSIDQIIGAKLAGQNTASAIQKHVVAARMRTVSDGDRIINNWAKNISFYNRAPSLAYTNPQKLFNDIFGGLPIPTEPTDPDQPSTQDMSKYTNVLDVHLADIQKKKSLASKEDKIVLDRWLTSYEELRRSLTSSGSGGGGGGSGVSCTKPAKPANLDVSDEAKIGDNYLKVCDAFLDLFLSAMECGARQVFTIMMQAESAGGLFNDQLVAAEDLHSEAGRSVTLSDMKANQHLGMAHYGLDGEDMLKYLRLVTLNNFYMRKYRRVIEGLKQRGLFDNSLAICTYGFRDGQHKTPDDFPFICSGRGGGFKLGQHHRLTTDSPQNAGKNGKTTPIHNFWVSVLKKYGINYSNAYSTGNCDSLFG